MRTPRVTEQKDQSPLQPPIFYDVTLRDGNQALAKPMIPEQKLMVFEWLKALGVKCVEVGYPAASSMDFQACRAIAEQAPADMTIAVLARSNEADIDSAIAALKYVKLATPRLHTFIGMSEFHMVHVLNKRPDQVRDMAVSSVKRAKAGLVSFGERLEIQFSPEHFGACQDNLDWVIETLQEIVAAGANVINLPNTVERSRPTVFTDLVEKVIAALPKSVIVSVHCHNDLGMATATTVESYFRGARQLEVTLNGLGERAGNTSLYEAAVALRLNGVPVGLDLKQIYGIAIKVAELTGEPISPKAPVIGRECLYHRSGIHQHGAIRTFQRAGKAYLPFDPAIAGRAGDEELRFTSQSGYTAVLAIVKETGRLISEAEARLLQPGLKDAAQTRGELTTEEIVDVYDKYVALKSAKPLVSSEDVTALIDDAIRDRGQQIWQRVYVLALAGDHPAATIGLRRNGEQIIQVALGDGPVDAAFKAIELITGVKVKIEKYHIDNLTSGADSQGKVVCGLRHDGCYSEGASSGTDVVIASVDAYLEALNKLLLGGDKRQP